MKLIDLLAESGIGKIVLERKCLRRWCICVDFMIMMKIGFEGMGIEKA